MAETTNKNTPAPGFQPNGLNPDAANQKFGTSEILWWNNGIWGDAGYALPNDGGKPTTANETMYSIHNFVGRELFKLMHSPDVKFSRPFNADWLFNLNKMLKLGIKRLGDYSVSWTDSRNGDALHALNTPKAFNVFPVPYFGGRVRQLDAKRWCGITMLLLSEIMQHSDNDYDDNITDLATAYIQSQMKRIQQDMAMKYLGFSREEVTAPGFDVPDTAFSKGVYSPENLFTESELIEERMPEQWWPQANDLTPINGIPANVANIWAQRWPDADGFYGDRHAEEASFPSGGTGLVPNVVPLPGARPQ
jgi:hypothetical protein